MESFLTMIRQLENYTPEDKHFTTFDEIDVVTTTLNLKQMNRCDIQNMRDMVVMYYSRLIENARVNDPDKFDFYNNAMMSITSIIDYFKLNHLQMEV